MTKKRIVSRRKYVDPDMVGKTRPQGSSKRVVRHTQESLWDCNSCGRKDIPGRNKLCPSCGHTKDSTEEYRPPAQDAHVLSIQELLEMGVDSDHSSDQICEFCGSKNKPGTQKCTQCGANIGDVARADRICDNCGRETNQVTCPNCASVTRSKHEVRPTPKARTSYMPVSYSLPRRRSSSGFSFSHPAVWGTALVVALIALLMFVFRPQEAEVQVQSVSWKAQILLQEYQYNRHEGWSLPAGADLIRTEQRVHHTEKVQDGTKTENYTERVCGPDVYDYTEVVTYDDGTTDTIDHYKENCWDEPRTRQVPNMVDREVERTYYFYNQWEWVSISPAVTRGSDYNPYWPTDYRIDDTHRESGRRMDFSVHLIDRESGDTFTYSPNSLEEFRTFNINSAWHIVHRGGIVTEIQRVER